MTREAFHEKILAYLRSYANLPDEWLCDSSENLFDLGVLESFDLPFLVEHIEKLLDGHIDLGVQRIEVFYTLDSIYEAFVAKSEASCAP